MPVIGSLYKNPSWERQGNALAGSVLTLTQVTDLYNPPENEPPTWCIFTFDIQRPPLVPFDNYECSFVSELSEFSNKFEALPYDDV
jgi:hypothetical protein